MSPKSPESRPDDTLLPFRIHPRAFKALGADLVTNDVVAIMELVKNAYDAYATVVDIRFRELGSSGATIEIEDNGSGMDRRVIEEAWCTVATPYRRDHRFATRSGRKKRRASGEKGLGRLSAARLGDRMEMLTQAKDEPCWRVQVDWLGLAAADELEACNAKLFRETPGKLGRSGTVIRIQNLRTDWDNPKLNDLRDNLARLLPPFETADSFRIRMAVQGREEPIDIASPDFLKYPKYLIRGDVTDCGTAHYSYQYNEIQGDGKRRKTGEIRWNQVREMSDDSSVSEIENPTCGPFSFEIRAWDIAPRDTQEISERFELKKSSIRSDIRAYKGISVYRDGILVLPKAESGRDWLGLDLRRVGRVGSRLSTPQIVGHVAISADSNPHIEDTSDREKLGATKEVTEFGEYLKAIVSTLENEREKDRRSASKEKRVVELFQQLNAKELVASVSQVVEEGGTADEALPLVREFSDKLDKAREEIESRFIYYSRLATVGTIAQMLVHEVRNRTTVIGSAMQTIRKIVEPEQDKQRLTRRLDLADLAIAALERLADTFAPLANRSFRRRIRSAIVEEGILRSVSMLEGDLKSKKIRINVPSQGHTAVAVDPGELDAILLNLLSNAVYWLGRAEEGSRTIEVRLSHIDSGSRVRVAVHDSGPGVPDDDVERIFWPGVTNKPGGIGMGLTVAAELVSEYGGSLALQQPGRLGGATFRFDLPIRSEP